MILLYVPWLVVATCMGSITTTAAWQLGALPRRAPAQRGRREARPQAYVVPSGLVTARSKASRA